MWKKAFVILLSLNLMVFILAGLWWTSLPSAQSVQQQVGPNSPSSPTGANVQLAVNDQTINTYMQYELAKQPDMKQVLSYVHVQFSQTWNIQLGVKLSHKIVPCDIVIAPTILNGNLDLSVLSATMGEIPVPPSALFLVFRHLPWPAWIQVDATHQILALNFTARPQHPYGIQVLSYSPLTKQLMLLISITPAPLKS